MNRISEVVAYSFSSGANEDRIGAEIAGKLWLGFSAIVMSLASRCGAEMRTGERTWLCESNLTSSYAFEKLRRMWAI